MDLQVAVVKRFFEITCTLLSNKFLKFEVNSAFSIRDDFFFLWSPIRAMRYFTMVPTLLIKTYFVSYLKGTRIRASRYGLAYFF